MRALLAVIALLAAPLARPQPFPARTGETGILDVPDSEVMGLGGGQLGVDLGYSHAPGVPDDFGPLPLYAVTGLAPALDLGVTMRELGEVGDARPGRFTFGGALKLQLLRPAGFTPGAALSAVIDRINGRGVLGARAAFSTAKGPFRAAAFGGAEATSASDIGLTAGGAITVSLTRKIEFAAEALTGPRGENVGAALRYALGPTTGLSLGGNYFPGDEGFRVSLSFAIAPALQRARAEEPAPRRADEPSAIATAPRFSDDRPRFRLRIRVRGPDQLGAAAHLQHGPTTLRKAEAIIAAKPEPGTRAAAPSLEDLAEAQIREQEALADTRERRIRSTSEQLDAREKAAQDEQKRLGDLERELAGREQQLDARGRTIPAKGPPTQQQRQLESLEAQLASQERNLAAQERSYGPALDAAEGRAREAAAREDAERQEANRLSASVNGASSRALQLDIRKQANAARNRQLAALEARLVARGEHLDALERQLRTKNERLDAWSRRLQTRAERLDLIERIGAEPKAPPAVAKPPGPATGAATPKDKAAFVMVVKSPTAIVKERSAEAATAAPAPVHAGVAVEKAVAAATVLMFPTPTSPISELDAEALTNIAKLAARERCELLIWARAKDQATMAEAQRRASDIQTRAIAAGPLDPAQVVTRLTVRPGAKGVDVVVSALRESAKPAATGPAAPAPTKLLPGESGNRQLREAVQAAQASMEVCVGDLLEAKRLSRAEGVLRLTIGTTGHVTRVTTGAGDISGSQVEECLGAASKQWVFPATEGEYVVDVPITVMRGGAAR